MYGLFLSMSLFTPTFNYFSDTNFIFIFANNCLYQFSPRYTEKQPV